ncbi:MAG: hypothetical protein ILP07_09720, partial [Treponema sp.]|nr:hypothetical protein [Treponema sp.]
RLEVENPGGLYGRTTVDELGTTAVPTRNPFLAGALEVMKVTENRFSGIPTIRTEMKKANLPPAEFIDFRGRFKVILRNKAQDEVGYKNLDEDPTTRRILEYCETPRTREEIASVVGVKTVFYVMNHYVRPLILSGKIQMTIPEKPKSKNQRYVRK